MNTTGIIIRPILTEKATDMVQKNIYTFEVSPKANKNTIREALTVLYSVKVGDVAVQIRKGKEKRVGRRMQTKKVQDKKIAYVTVLEGTINLFPKP